MANRLRDAVSPYLQSHAQNPVEWYPWGAEAFAEASRRDVPILVSIGYSTCHWCHVMARESFSDPALATYLNRNFVSIKVDREEHPDVDASYLAAAGAFTENLGWPLNVFVTPAGKPFYAGTYWPPTPLAGHPSFRQVLDAILDAFTSRRAEVESNAATVAKALSSAEGMAGGPLPGAAQLDAAVQELANYEDDEFGGFGRAPKFPIAPVLLFLLERAAAGDNDALALAERTLAAIAGSSDTSGAAFTALRDRVGGGFFRYATGRDWSDPHYERMLYDNAQLLTAFTRLSRLSSGASDRAAEIAEGIADFLISTMQQADGGFASAQDSESTVDGARVEGAYYALDASARSLQQPPTLDAKVLTGWNGLAIGALADAGATYGRAHWIDAARRAADTLISRHIRPDGSLLRASIGGRASAANATLEDFGMLAGGLLTLALTTGEVRYAVVARSLVDTAMAAANGSVTAPTAGVQAAGVAAGERGAAVGGPPERAAAEVGLTAGADLTAGAAIAVPLAVPFAVPGGADPLLVSHGTALEIDPSEGAYPSGLSALAAACYDLYLLTGYARYREASARAVELLAPLAVPRPISFGAALCAASALCQPIEQLVVVSDDPGSTLADVARSHYRSGSVTAVVTREQAAAFADAEFELFVGRQREAAYLCHNFVCRLPLTDSRVLAESLAG